jgi:hypothetical protein
MGGGEERLTSPSIGRRKGSPFSLEMCWYMCAGIRVLEYLRFFYVRGMTRPKCSDQDIISLALQCVTRSVPDAPVDKSAQAFFVFTKLSTCREKEQSTPSSALYMAITHTQWGRASLLLNV